jgi:hypothetical protein
MCNITHKIFTQKDKFMTQGNFNFDSDNFDPKKEFSPEWSAGIFLTPDELKTQKDKLLAILRQSDYPRTKKELAMALFPNAFDNRNNVNRYVWDGYKQRSIKEILEKTYIEKTGQIIRTIDASIRNDLNQLETREEKINFLREVPLVIRVGEDENQAAFYAYHGPDNPQSLEILQEYCEWAQTHQYKQSKLLEQSQLIEASVSTADYGPLFIGQIDTSFYTPDDEMNILEDDENTDGLENIS